MRPEEGTFEGLRLAAKAADRGKAAQRERPGFEKPLKELGHSPLAITHAFSTLTAGTVEEALTELEEHARSERVVPVPLAFEVVEREPELPVGHALTITGVERHGRGIRITYGIQPPRSQDSSSLWQRPTHELRITL